MKILTLLPMTQTKVLELEWLLSMKLISLALVFVFVSERGSREALGDKDRDEVVDTDLGRILEAVVAVGTEEPRAKVFEGGP